MKTWLRGRHNMLWSKTHSDQPSRDSAKDWKATKEFERPRQRKSLLTAQNTSDDTILNEHLHALRQTSWQLSTTLYFAKILWGDYSSAKTRGKKICRSNGILNG